MVFGAIGKAMTGSAKDQTLKVFISYSRADLSFADELAAGLAYDGRYEVAIDRHSIIEGEDWRLRLGALIAGADTVVFADPFTRFGQVRHLRVEKRGSTSPLQADPASAGRASRRYFCAQKAVRTQLRAFRFVR